jgi:hypothetical protein
MENCHPQALRPDVEQERRRQARATATGGAAATQAEGRPAISDFHFQTRKTKHFTLGTKCETRVSLTRVSLQTPPPRPWPQLAPDAGSHRSATLTLNVHRALTLSLHAHADSTWPPRLRLVHCLRRVDHGVDVVVAIPGGYGGQVSAFMQPGKCFRATGWQRNAGVGREQILRLQSGRRFAGHLCVPVRRRRS